MKRFLTIIVILLATLSVHAVLKEKDLAQTLQILRAELNTQHNELSERSELDNKRSEQMRNRLFDLTYACHEATEQYQEFQRQRIPFKQFMSKTEGEIARYDSLIGTLNSMPQRVLSPQAQKDRTACLALAYEIREKLEKNRDKMNDFIEMYDHTEKRLSRMNDYAAITTSRRASSAMVATPISIFSRTSTATGASCRVP